jgi:hypothetical protein
MSNIPIARAHLRAAIQYHADDAAYLCKSIELALAYMTRERPKFVAEVELPPLTDAQRVIANQLRYGKHWSLNRIATFLHTNIGRVSTAVNGKG